MTKLPYIYKYLTKIKLNIDKKRQEAFPVDAYDSTYCVPEGGANKPISKIIDLKKLNEDINQKTK
ncbi:MULTISPECIES: hypothetical protein [Chryseobacterium]|uniref:Uncharacterized protein n=1 Tax=Chryseobacterium culicis TaxID=680127 RepID=A0A2S9D2M1_CHRCI|nr:MULTISPECIES: hypothetical protein [Chryseobacterium]MBP1167066.1 hypothetical protein [Chryseobacterium sp. PvR013]MDR4893557.1 hypothetical protein [Chryseobacterium sp. CFS7]PRB86956.1 hypothetical protein CQ022_12145 [Chryseobacterium culicis]PRB92708.1 hypothetical protein CQ033_05815 [Chryseobacterium culicis]